MPAPLDPCVRAARDLKSLEAGSSENPNQHFFPWDDLWDYFQRDERSGVREVLTCTCASCANDAELFDKLSQPVEYLDDILGVQTEPGTRPDWSHTSVSLLALFVYIGRPRFITPFLQNDRRDPHLEEYIGKDSIDTLPVRYWPQYADRSPGDSKILAKEVYKHIPKFAVPRLDSPRYVSWTANRILPFLDEQELGSATEEGNIKPDGANSRVFAFKIHPEYHGFSDHVDIEEFVRKEILVSANVPPLLVALEKQALERVGSLSHPHIVRMIKSYKLGDKYNIVFPRASTNLDKYLRDRAFGAEQQREGPFEHSPVWNQLCGITEALSQIHSFGTAARKRTDITEEERLIGYHFDIKDANILVERSGDWVISDFGQATFKNVERGGTTTRVLNNQGGTDAYAPPEFNLSFEKLGRSFDIWSLGCIFLEVVSFVVRGYDGLVKDGENAGLDHVRHTKTNHGPRREDHRFYTEGRKQGSYVVKRGIKKFMGDLENHLQPRSPKAKQLLKDFLGLVDRMLNPIAGNRPEADEVLRDLKSYIKKAKAASSTTSNSLDRNKSSPMRGTKAIDPQALSEIAEAGLFLYNSDGHDQVELRVHQKEKGGLKMVNIRKSNGSEILSDLWPKSALIPYFAFPSMRSRGASRSAISFISEQGHSGLGKVEDLNYDFVGGDSVHKDKFQSVMTGQSLSDSFLVSDLKMVRKPQNPIKKLTARLSKVFEDEHEHVSSSGRVDLNGKEAKAQLWTQIGSTMPQVERSKPQSRVQWVEQSQNEVEPCRIVFYCDRSIIIVRLAQNQKIQRPSTSSQKASRTQLFTSEITPTNKNRDESFQAMVIHPLDLSNLDSYAAIPLDHHWLQMLEEGHGIDEFNCHIQEYTSISFRFKDAHSKADLNSNGPRVEVIIHDY
ncbi:MAG: hypothetical protein M1821_004373 [Bathelium mastoideum]|nr:MAG: hypothetical protein M1821_004373 [Bathelium mastoideum]